MTQPVEHTPVAVAPEMKSGDAAGAVTNTVNTTGTTPTATSTDSAISKLPDTRPASKMDDSLTRSTAAVNNSIASTFVSNIPIATVAMSSGMTSAQSLPSANPTGSSTNASCGASSTLPLFPVTPAVVTSLITEGTQTATTHPQVNRIPFDYYPTVPPSWGGTSQHSAHTPYYAPYGGTSSCFPPLPGAANGNNPDSRWMGGYDPGRGMYDAGQVTAPPRDGSRNQHDPGGSRQRHVSRRADGNAPDRFRHMDRDRNAHRDRQEQQRLPFPKFPEFDGSGSWKSFIASFVRVCVHYDFGEQDMVEWLPLCLRGKAQSYVTSLPYEIQNHYDDLVRHLEQRFEPCSTQVALSLLHQAAQYEEESLCEFADRIRELALQASQPENGELSSSLRVHIFLRGCIDKQAALQAFLVEHRNLEQAVTYMKMICSSKNVLFGRNKVRQHRQVTFSDSEPTFMEGRRETDADIEYTIPPGVQRVASSFKETQEEFVSPAIEQRFGEMRSEFGESLNEVRSGQRKNAEALNELSSLEYGS